MPILPKYRTEFTNNGEREIFNHAVNSGYFNNLKRYFIHSLRNQNIKGKVVGEVDFVYLDENYVIFLESKGGNVKYDSATDSWLVLGGTKKGDPFKQVTDYLFYFRDTILGEFPNGAFYRSKLIFGYGVMFPDIQMKTSFEKHQKQSKSYRYETIEYDPSIIYFATDHRNEKSFVEYLERLKSYWKEHHKYSNKTFNGIGLKGVDEIRKIFRKDLIFDIPLGNVLKDNNRTIDKYTEEQYRILDSMTFFTNRGFVVTGGPGTGKTLLAKEVAIQKNKEGAKVAYFCFNKNLAAEVRRGFDALENCNIDSFNVHQYLHDILKSNDLLPNGDKQTSYYWREILPLQFKEWINTLNASKYDFIILDEAQDVFTENLVDSIFGSLKGGVESGNWLIFIDFVYQGFYEGFDEEFFRLFIQSYPCSFTNIPLNCRNHDNIISVASKHSGMELMPCRSTNVPFKTRTKFYNSNTELYSLIKNEIQEIITSDLNHSNITVLTLERSQINEIENNVSIPFHHVNEENHKIENRTCISTIHSYKGLENDFIIIVGNEMYNPNDKENMSLLFVGYTRARLGLVILYPIENEKKLAAQVLKSIP